MTDNQYNPNSGKTESWTETLSTPAVQGVTAKQKVQELKATGLYSAVGVTCKDYTARITVTYK